MEKKETRGGARAGAGRKKLDEKVKYISKSVTIPGEKWEQLEKKAEALGTTKNKLIANLIEIFLK